MKKIHPAAWMRAALLPLFLCFALLDFLIIPVWGWGIAHSSPELSVYFWPWLTFAWLASAPVYAALATLWKLSAEFKKESPVNENGARILRRVAFYAAGIQLLRSWAYLCSAR